MATSPDFARIPAGEFLMGAADADEHERPVHRVYVSEFFIGRFPVTQDEYARFVRATGYPAPAVGDVPLIGREDTEAFAALAAAYVWHGAAPPRGAGSHPVVLVRYDDAVAYCAWMTAELGRPVRLPTEAEWEKASRGGVEGQRYPLGPSIDLTRAAFLGAPSAKKQRGTRPTGTYPPNGFGLYDMVGNVWEWVNDWYAADYYSIGEPLDPRGPAEGTMRLVRGGSWVTSDLEMLRCAHRHQVPPDTYAPSIGFRVVCEN